MRTTFPALLLFLATVAHGEICRFEVPVRSSNLKCGDQIYHASPEAIAASNECSQGKNGKEITIADHFCFMTKRGFIKDGVFDAEKVRQENKGMFPLHHEALSQGVEACVLDAATDLQMKEPQKHLDCFQKVYEDVCGHKTCDWMNTVDSYGGKSEL